MKLLAVNAAMAALLVVVWFGARFVPLPSGKAAQALVALILMFAGGIVLADFGGRTPQLEENTIQAWLANGILHSLRHAGWLIAINACFAIGVNQGLQLLNDFGVTLALWQVICIIGAIIYGAFAFGTVVTWQMVAGMASTLASIGFFTWHGIRTAT